MRDKKHDDEAFMPNLGMAHRRFPSGEVTLLTESTRVAEKLELAAAASGILRRREAGAVVIDVPHGVEDSACLTFGSFLSALEQEKVFAIRDGAAGPRLRSLRRILAECQYAWFSEFLQAGSFTAFLQPIVDLETQTAYGFEALLRASHVDGTQVPPQNALAIARATDTLPEFDARARRAALEAASRHLLPTERIFVNIDPGSVPRGAADFESTLELVRRLLHQPPDRVVFELTESEGISDSWGLGSLLTRLREGGFKVALDDLGSGYSTLNALERLRPDIVKLDGRLVQGAHADRYRARLVQAFAELSRDLQLPLIAEGVETRDDYEFVRDQGIRLAQGYFFGMPAPTATRSFQMLEATGAR